MQMLGVPHTGSVTRLSRDFLSGALAVVFLSVPAVADVNSRIKQVTGFSGVSANDLADGSIRTSMLSFNRNQDLGVESLFFVPATPDSVVNRITSWSPTSHPELGVYIHQEISIPPAAKDFAKLDGAASNAAMRLLERETLRSIQRFNLSNAEKGLANSMFAKDKKPDAVRRFWKQLLNERATTYFTQGVAKLPPYSQGGKEIKVREETLALIRSQPKIFGNFKPILADAIFAPKDSIKRKAYWELFSIQGFGTFNLGAIYWQKGGEGWQVVDYQYYYSSGLYANLILYQIWPAQSGGRSGSVVWRCDLLSSPFFDSSGVNRMGTNMMMQQEIKKTIEMIKSDLQP